MKTVNRFLFIQLQVDLIIPELVLSMHIFAIKAECIMKRLLMKKH